MEEKAIVQKEDKAKVAIVNGQFQPTDMDGMWRLSTIMAASGMVPKDYVNKPNAVFVAVQMGMEVGLSPMQAIQNIAVINGRPCIWGDAGVALVDGSGLVEDRKEFFEGEKENDNYTAICQVWRKDRKTVIEGRFSIADAKKAKLWGQNTWAKYPDRMLKMRARAFALRDGFADVLKGIGFREEVQDIPKDNSIIEAETETIKDVIEIEPPQVEIHED